MWIEKEKTLTRRILLPVKAIVFIFFISTSISLVFGNTLQFKSFYNYFEANGFGVTVGVVFWLVNWAIGHYIGSHLDWRKKPVQANVISLTLFFATGIVISFLIPYIFGLYVWHVAPEHFIRSTIMSAFICLTADLIVVALYYSRYMVFAYQHSLQSEEALKRETLLAKYEALKNQVNPHFLFNTLNTLAGVVEQTPEQAPEFIHRFSSIYRYVLEQRDKEVVSIAEELEFLENYIYLAKIRHGNGLIVNISVNKKEALIAPMGLQMLFENAIKHNVITDDEPLTVEIGTEPDYVFVRNNLQPRNTIEGSSKLGLENLTRRYQYLTPKPVVVNKTQTVFEVKLPVITKLES